MFTNTRRRRFMGVFVVLACSLLPGAAGAASGTWNQSAAGTYYWTNSPNWVSGTIPRAAGDSAAVSADLAGAQTINLGAAITNGTLTLGDPTPPCFSYTLANGTGGSLVMSNSGTPAVIGKSGQTSDLISASITLGDSLILTNAQNDKSQSLRLSGIISGSKSLSVNGAGPNATIELSGANTFTNVLTLNSGTLRANTSAGALGAGTAALALNGGTLDFNNDAALAFSRNTTVNGNATIISERSAGGGGYTYTLGTLGIGARTLTVGGGNVSSGTAGLTFGATTLSGAPTFAINNPAAGGTTLLTLGAITDNGNSLTLTGNGNFAQAGVWSGTGGLILDAGYSGFATLSQANTFTGGITITAGTLKAGLNACIPNGAGKGNVVVNGKLDLNGYNPTINGVSGTGVIDQSWVGAAVFTLTAGGNDQTSAFNGVITNTGAALALTKTGTGTLTLTGANSYSGATAINGGAVSINSLAGVNGGASALGAPTTAATGTIAIGSATTAGTLIYTGPGHASDRVINLAGTTGGATLDASGTGPLVLSSAFTATGAGSKTLTLTGASTGTNSLLGAIVNGAGTVSLLKTNSGTWVLAGINTFTGATMVAGGTLRVTGSLSAGSPVTVWSNATLGGNGTCAGAVSNRTAGTLAPGVDGTAGGALTIGRLTLSNGCMNAFEFSSGPTPTNDTLLVTNGLTIATGAGVYLYAEGTTNAWTAPGLYNLIRYSGALTGSATNLAVLNPLPGKTYLFAATNGWISLRADLPEVAVLPASNVTPDGVRMNGLVVNGGGEETPAVYFCWDFSDKGTSATGAWGHVDAAGASWSAGQAFSNDVTGLLSGSNYAYRCFASNSTGFGWSPTAAGFRTVYLPAVTNMGATTVNSSTELLRGAVTDTGAEAPQVWFLVWLSGGSSTNAYGVGATTGACSAQASGLLPGSNYVFMLMASNQAGVVYSGTNGFQTVNDYYVATTGNDGAAGTDWSTALLTISNAVGRALPGATIWVTNGTYGVNIYATNGPYVASGLVITNGVTLRSVNGAASTVIMRSNASYQYRPLYISNINAVVDGFTISNGTRGGVYIDGGGTVSNCVIRDNNGALNVIFAGGGVYLMNGGLVKNCRIINNSITYSGGNGGNGGGVYINGGGMLDTCVISNNLSSYGTGGNGGGVYMIGGRLRNCLIANNRHTIACSGVFCNGGTIESCTIVDNYCPTVGGVGGLYLSNGRVLNSIVAYNTCVTGTFNYVNAGTWSYSNSCVYPASGLAGSGNTAADPQFRDRATADYRLLPGPCVDAGTNQPSWMGDAADLGGSPRIQYGTVDMGAYEHTVGALACSFEGTPLTAFMSNNAVFSANVSGTNTADLYYRWSFTNGEAFDAEGLGLQVATNLYWPGLYSVRLEVTNAAGEVATQVKTSYVKVGPATNFVSTNGASVYPYLTWATAATNIQAAIDAGVDGTKVVVTDGVYVIANQINLNQNIKVMSVNGASNTIVRRGSGNTRIFYVSRPNAVIDGFTLTNANLGAIYLDGGGTVSNCIIRDNISLNNSANGGGVALQGGGLVYNCQIFNNVLNSSGGAGASGAGVFLNGGGMVDSCVISNNFSSYGTAGNGGGVYMSGGRIRNCLIVNNQHNMAGSGVYNSGGIVENCTIASNRCPLVTGVGGLYSAGGRILNSIIYFNSSSTIIYNYTNAGAASSYTNCCTFPTNGLVGKGNIDSDPLFVNVVAGNCRLKRGSPCVDAGTNQAWMANGFDLDGQTRIFDNKLHAVDMGAYESTFPSRSGTLIMIR